MSVNNKIDYVEFAAQDLEATRAFFTAAFGWGFEDYGPDYCSFADQGTHGGFYRSEKSSTTDNSGALVILYSDQLENTLDRVVSAGGVISKEIFSFPGGRRFHFIEPSGNELAVWSDV